MGYGLFVFLRMLALYKKTSKSDIVFGKITKSCPLKILSKMPENGVILSDGIESDYLQFNSGIEAVIITVAETKGHLIV